MDFIRSTGIGILFFLSSIMAGSLSLFRIAPNIPPSEVFGSATSATSATTTPQINLIFKWIRPEQLRSNSFKDYIFNKVIPIADAATLVVGVHDNLTPAFYAKDRNRVYYLYPYSGLDQSPTVIIDADPLSFAILTPMGLFAKDRDHVYAAGTIVPDADAHSFVILQCLVDVEFGDGCQYAKDDNHVFYLNPIGKADIIEGADPTSFVSLSSIGFCSLGPNCLMDAYDSNAVYYYGSRTPKT